MRKEQKPKLDTLREALLRRMEFYDPPKLVVAIKNDVVIGVYDTPSDVKELIHGRFFQSVQYVKHVHYVGHVALAFMEE